MIWRAINVAIAVAIAYIVYHNTYIELYSYLPTYDKLQSLNNSPSISNVLRDNSTSLRDLYNHALEKSILFGFIAFLTALAVFHYIGFGTLLKKAALSVADDYKAIRKMSDKEGHNEPQ